VEEDKEDGDEEVVRPAWMDMEPMKGPPPDLPSKGTTSWWEDED